MLLSLRDMKDQTATKIRFKFIEDSSLVEVWNLDRLMAMVEIDESEDLLSAFVKSGMGNVIPLRR